MELTSNSTQKQKLPFIDMDTKLIGTRDLQKTSSKSLDTLKETGPKIITVGGEKKAVLIDYNDYLHFQKRFQKIFKLATVVNQIFPIFNIPEGHKLQIDSLKMEMEGTLKEIIIESPESSPFTDLMDAVMSVAKGLFNNSETAPIELKKNAKDNLMQNVKKSRGQGVQPKKYFTE